MQRMTNSIRVVDEDVPEDVMDRAGGWPLSSVATDGAQCFVCFRNQKCSARLSAKHLPSLPHEKVSATYLFMLTCGMCKHNMLFADAFCIAHATRPEHRKVARGPTTKQHTPQRTHLQTASIPK